MARKRNTGSSSSASSSKTKKCTKVGDKKAVSKKLNRKKPIKSTDIEFSLNKTTNTNTELKRGKYKKADTATHPDSQKKKNKCNPITKKVQESTICSIGNKALENTAEPKQKEKKETCKPKTEQYQKKKPKDKLILEKTEKINNNNVEEKKDQIKTISEGEKDKKIVPRRSAIKKTVNAGKMSPPIKLKCRKKVAEVKKLCNSSTAADEVQAAGPEPTPRRMTPDNLSEADKLDQLMNEVEAAGPEPTPRRMTPDNSSEPNHFDDLLIGFGDSDEEIQSTLSQGGSVWTDINDFMIKKSSTVKKSETKESSMSMPSVNVSASDNAATLTPIPPLVKSREEFSTKPLITTDTKTYSKQKIDLVEHCVNNNEDVVDKKKSKSQEELSRDDNSPNSKKKKRNSDKMASKKLESSMSMPSVNVSASDNAATLTPILPLVKSREEFSTKPLITIDTKTDSKQKIDLVEQCVNNNEDVVDEKHGLLRERIDSSDTLSLDSDFGVNEKGKKKTYIKPSLDKFCSISIKRASENKLKTKESKVKKESSCGSFINSSSNKKKRKKNSDTTGAEELESKSQEELSRDDNSPNSKKKKRNSDKMASKKLESSMSMPSVNVSASDNAATLTPIPPLVKSREEFSTKPLITTDTKTDSKQKIDLVELCVNNNEDVVDKKQDGLLRKRIDSSDTLSLDSDFGVNEKGKKKTYIKPSPDKFCSISIKRASENKLKTKESKLKKESSCGSFINSSSNNKKRKNNFDTTGAEEQEKSQRKRPKCEESSDSINLERKRKSSERVESEAEGKMTTSTPSDSTTFSSYKLINECLTRQPALIISKLTLSDVDTMKLAPKSNKIQPTSMKHSPVPMKREVKNLSPASDENAGIGKRKYSDSYVGEMQKELYIKVLRLDEAQIEGQKRKEIFDKCSSVSKDPIKNDLIMRLGGWDRLSFSDSEIDKCEEMILESGRGELDFDIHLKENWELSNTPNRDRTINRYDENELLLLGEIIEDTNFTQSLSDDIYSSLFDCNKVKDVPPTKLDSKNKKLLEDLDLLPLSRESSVRADQPLHENQHRTHEEQNNNKLQSDRFGSTQVKESNKEADYIPKNYLPQTSELFSDLECFMNENRFDYQGSVSLASNMEKSGENVIEEICSFNRMKDEQTAFSIVDHKLSEPLRPVGLSKENLSSTAEGTLVVPKNLTVQPSEFKSIEARNMSLSVYPSAERESLSAHKNLNVQKNQNNSVKKNISSSADSSEKGGTMAAKEVPKNQSAQNNQVHAVKRNTATSGASAMGGPLAISKNLAVQTNQIHAVKRNMATSDASAMGGPLAISKNLAVQTNQIHAVKRNMATSGASAMGGPLAISKNLAVQTNQIHAVKRNMATSGTSAMGHPLAISKNLPVQTNQIHAVKESMPSSASSSASGAILVVPKNITELKKQTQSPEENMTSTVSSNAKGEIPATPLTALTDQVRASEVTKHTSYGSTTPMPKLNKKALIRQNVYRRRAQIANLNIMSRPKPMPTPSPSLEISPEKSRKTIQKREDGSIYITRVMSTAPSQENSTQPLTVTNSYQSTDQPNGCRQKLAEIPNSVEQGKPVSPQNEQITKNSVLRKSIMVDPSQITNFIKSKPFDQGKVLPANTKLPRKKITFEDDKHDLTNKTSNFSLPKPRIDIKNGHKERVIMNDDFSNAPSSLGIKEHSFIMPKPVMPMAKLPPNKSVFASIAISATSQDEDDDTGSVISLFVNSELEYDVEKTVTEENRRINLPGNNTKQPYKQIQNNNNSPHTTKRTQPSNLKFESNENNRRWDRLKRSDVDLMSEFGDDVEQTEYQQRSLEDICIEETMAEDQTSEKINNKISVANWVNGIPTRKDSLPDTFSANSFFADSPLQGVCPRFLCASITSEQHPRCQLSHKVPIINHNDRNLCEAIENLIKTGFCNPPHEVLQLFISACFSQNKRMTLKRIVKALNEHNIDNENRAKTIWKEFIRLFLYNHTKGYHQNHLSNCPSTTLNEILRDTFTEDNQIKQHYLKNLSIILNCLAEESKKYPSVKVMHCVDFLKDKISLHDCPLVFKIRVVQQVLECIQNNRSSIPICPTSQTAKFMFKVYKSFFEPLENPIHVDQMYTTNPTLVKSYLDTFRQTFPQYEIPVMAYLRRVSKERSPSLESSSLSSGSPFPQKLGAKNPQYRPSSSPQSPINPFRSSENPSPIFNNPARLSNNFSQVSDPPGWTDLCKELRNLVKNGFAPKGLNKYLNACNFNDDVHLKQIFEIFHGYSNGCIHYLQMLRACSAVKKRALNSVTFSMISSEVKKKEWKVCYNLSLLLINFNPTIDQDFLIPRSPASKVFLIIEILLKNGSVKKAVDHFIDHRLYGKDPLEWTVESQQPDMQLWDGICQDMTKALGETDYEPVVQCSMLLTIIKAQRSLDTPIVLKYLVREFLCQLMESKEPSIAVHLVTEIVDADCVRQLLVQDPNYYRILIHRMVKRQSLQQAMPLVVKARLRVDVYPNDIIESNPEIVFYTCLTDNEMMAIIRCKLKSWDDQIHQNIRIHFKKCDRHSVSSELVQYLGPVECSLAAALDRCRGAIKRLIPGIGSGLLLKGDSLVIDHIVCSNLLLSSS